MSLDLSALARQYPPLSIESFPDENFRDISCYNRMLLNDEFYARFAEYEYALIHQLDAFVFSDRLLEWCKLGYDYIGAPWLPYRAPPTTYALSVPPAPQDLSSSQQERSFRHRTSSCPV
jgi:hypothetical protein